MHIDINQTLKKAITAHQSGMLHDAEQLYRSILEVEPNNLVCHNNLGVILKRFSKLEAAEKSFKKAIELK